MTPLVKEFDVANSKYTIYNMTAGKLKYESWHRSARENVVHFQFKPRVFLHIVNVQRVKDHLGSRFRFSRFARCSPAVASLRGQRWLAPIFQLAVDCGSRGLCPGLLPENRRHFLAVPCCVSNPAGLHTVAYRSLLVGRAGLRSPSCAVNVSISSFFSGMEAESGDRAAGADSQGGEGGKSGQLPPINRGYFHPKAR